MSHNLLHLSSDKSEVLVIGPDYFSKEVRHYIPPLTNNIKTRKNWYTVQQLNFESHITTTSTTHLNIRHTSCSLSVFTDCGAFLSWAVMTVFVMFPVLLLLCKS